MFSDIEKAEIEALLGEAFDAFKEKILIYKTPTTTYVSTQANNFNFAWGAEQPAADVSYTTASGEFWATVEYVDQEDDQKLYHALNTPLKQPYGDVRISTSGTEAKNFLEDCEKIVLDGKDFRRVSDVMPRGIFNRNYFDCWLKKIDNGNG